MIFKHLLLAIQLLSSYIFEVISNIVMGMLKFLNCINMYCSVLQMQNAIYIIMYCIYVQYKVYNITIYVMSHYGYVAMYDTYVGRGYFYGPVTLNVYSIFMA